MLPTVKSKAPNMVRAVNLMQRRVSFLPVIPTSPYALSGYGASRNLLRSSGTLEKERRFL